jgi:methylglyoxal synthase
MKRRLIDDNNEKTDLIPFVRQHHNLLDIAKLYTSTTLDGLSDKGTKPILKV